MTTVRTEDRADGVRLVTLARPPANAIDESLLADLGAALERAAQDDGVRAVVLTGSGPFFSGGFDFAAPRRDADAERRIYQQYRDAHVALLTLPKPTVAMVNGHAIAGGLVLALACDHRVGATGDYRIGLNETVIGAAFPRIAFEITRLRLPHAAANELLLGAALYPAAEASRLGVVDEFVDPALLEATALRRAAERGTFPREAYAHAKSLLVAEAVARSAVETPDEAARTIAVWGAEESRAARRRQRERLGVRRSGAQ